MYLLCVFLISQDFDMEYLPINISSHYLSWKWYVGDLSWSWPSCLCSLGSCLQRFWNIWLWAYVMTVIPKRVMYIYILLSKSCNLYWQTAITVCEVMVFSFVDWSKAIKLPWLDLTGTFPRKKCIFYQSWNILPQKWKS